MNEETLTKRLREVPGVPLRSTIEERARQEAEMQLLRSRVMVYSCQLRLVSYVMFCRLTAESGHI